jgi:5'(3')-deoxyribonucleotidase
MSGKMNLFLDFDSTIVDSIKAYCDVYNTMFNRFEGFAKADPTLVNRWDLIDQCPLAKGMCEDIFSSPMFFQKLEMFPGANDVLLDLSYYYNIIICSIGTKENISRKATWIDHNLNFIDNLILISNRGVKMDKSIVDMKESIFIDDHNDNLKSSNAFIKCCYGKEYAWNVNSCEMRLVNWEEVRNFLIPRHNFSYRDN